MQDYEFKIISQKQKAQTALAVAFGTATLISLGLLLLLLTGTPNAALTALLGGVVAALGAATGALTNSVAGTNILDYMKERLGKAPTEPTNGT